MISRTSIAHISSSPGAPTGCSFFSGTSVITDVAERRTESEVTELRLARRPPPGPR